MQQFHGLPEKQKKKKKKKSKNIYKKIFPEYCRILRRVKAQPF